MREKIICVIEQDEDFIMAAFINSSWLFSRLSGHGEVTSGRGEFKIA